MVGSHSKGIYKADSDSELVAHIPYIKVIADELREKVKSKTYGFAKLYPRTIEVILVVRGTLRSLRRSATSGR